MQRDPRNFFPHPEGFWPERWLLASSKDGARGEKSDVPAGFTHAEHAFVPFSYGPMNCVGKSLALKEMRVVVCAIVQRFRMKEEGPGVGVRELGEYEEGFRDYYITERAPVWVKLEVRAAEGCVA